MSEGQGLGLPDRDYYRDQTDSFFQAWKRQGAVVWLIGLTSAAFFAECFPTGRPDGVLVQLGKYSYWGVESGEVWRLLTPLFLHAGLLHLVFNMLVLYWAGTKIENVYGPGRTLTLYLGAGVFANAINFLAENMGLLPPSTGIGASGAVTAVFVAFTLKYPKSRWLLFFIPVPAWLLLTLYLAMDVFGVFGFGPGGVGYLVHLGGALFGLSFHLKNLPASSGPATLKLTSKLGSRPALRLHQVGPEEVSEPEEPGENAAEKPRPPSPEQLELSLDRVLEKVSKQGQSSLTEEERQTLLRASEIYKTRRK